MLYYVLRKKTKDTNTYGCVMCANLFIFERPTNSILSILEAPTGQTEYSESNPIPPPILGKTR
ncbi:hypothetical protein Hdeb2414_s0006g00195101 [Helianthus debilis subsp. tardiflorus]